MTDKKLLKEQIDRLANRAIFFDIKDINTFHPIALIDATKSLISLDFENPNKELLDWIEKDVLKKTIIQKKESNHIVAENASFKELKEVLLNKEKNKIDRILANFNLLSDGSQLVEFFLEMSLYQSGISFINVWKSYKIFQFAQIDNKLSFYKLLSNFIFMDNFRENINRQDKGVIIEKVNNDPLDIILYSNLLDCSDIEFIRDQYVKNALESMNFYLASKVSSDDFLLIEYDNRKKDRKELLKIVNQIEDSISESNILLIDSMRILIKNNKNIADLLLDSIINKIEIS